MILNFPDIPLGDEINVYRCHLYFLLVNNIINNQTVLIHSMQDRYFLYITYFNNMFMSIESAYSTFPHIKCYPQYKLIDIFPFPIIPYSFINKSTISGFSFSNLVTVSPISFVS